MPSPHGVAHENERTQIESFNKTGEVRKMIGQSISSILYPLAFPMPSLVQGDHMKAVPDFDGQIIPQVGVGQKAVEEHHRRLARIPPIQVMQPDPRKLEILIFGRSSLHPVGFSTPVGVCFFSPRRGWVWALELPSPFHNIRLFLLRLSYRGFPYRIRNNDIFSPVDS